MTSGLWDVNRDLADHVLCKFLVEEEPVVEQSLDRAVAAVKDALSRGMRAAMTEHNRKSSSEQPPQLESEEEEPEPAAETEN